jgi:hypothetical protein
VTVNIVVISVIGGRQCLAHDSHPYVAHFRPKYASRCIYRISGWSLQLLATLLEPAKACKVHCCTISKVHAKHIHKQNKTTKSTAFPFKVVIKCISSWCVMHTSQQIISTNNTSKSQSKTTPHANSMGSVNSTSTSACISNTNGKLRCSGF